MAWKTITRSLRGLTLGAVAALGLGATSALADELETVTIEAAGAGPISAVLARPAADKAPAVVLIHEWWGLNDQIKQAARDYAAAGYLALAVDLYGGEVATEAKDAQRLMGAVDGAKATATLAAWMEWLRGHEAATGKVGTVGWCFGGAWSLNASIAAPADATVVYYGSVERSAADLAALMGPVLGHFATRDQRINQTMVSAFAAEMDKAGKSLETHWYEAEHAFANEGGARYDEAAAKLSWGRTMEFLGEHLR